MRILEQLEVEAHNLQAILERERHALKERDFGALLAWVAEKEAAVARLEELLKPLLEVPAWREDPAWTRICRLAARCQELNEANGAAIALLQEHNRQALALVFARSRKLLSYGADGQVQVEAGERWLGAI
jgi:flagellar biosynthesis/type III secretory pathway chaperone